VEEILLNKSAITKTNMEAKHGEEAAIEHLHKELASAINSYA